MYLSHQSCVILNIFLDATDCTLTDAEIQSRVWEKQEVTTKNFTSLRARFRNLLDGVDFLVLFKRVGYNQCCLILC